MKPRITINLTEMGELEIWVNETGRDLLVSELQRLSEKKDHLHFGPAEIGELGVCSRAYRPSDRILEYGKVLFRTDDWDMQHFPHVLDADSQSNPN